MPFTAPNRRADLRNAMLDTRPLSQGLTNLGNAFTQRRQEDENKRRYNEGIEFRNKQASAQETARAAAAERQAAQDKERARRFNLTHGLSQDRLSIDRDRFGLAAKRQAAQDKERARRFNLTHDLSQDRLTLDRDRFELDERYRDAQIEKLEREQTQRANVGPFKDLREKSQVEMGLRKEFSQLTKTFRDVRDAYGRIQSTNTTGAGDIALIFNYMKMLDPGSVVREGEFATAETAGGVGAKVWQLYNRVKSGERLSDTLRSDFKSQAQRLYDRANQQFQGLRQRYGEIARSYKLDPAMTAQDFSVGTPRPPPPAPAIKMLRENPDRAWQFDQMYGRGAAMRVLGQ